jgi:TonB family protein
VLRESDAMNTPLRTLLFCAMAWTAVQSVAQRRTSDPVPQNKLVTSPARSTSAQPPDVEAGVLIRAVSPTVPADASPKKRRGEIVLHASVASSGRVQDIAVVSGEPVLAGPAIDAVRQWQFAPCIQDGRPVESQITVTITYDLGRGASDPVDESPAILKEPPEDVIQEIEKGQLFQLRDGVTFPKALDMPSPEYSEAAQKAKLQGDVLLGVVVDTDGKPRSVWVVQTLGEGLDEKSVEAVRRWSFTPATKNGKPVPVLVNLAVPFRL